MKTLLATAAALALFAGPAFANPLVDSHDTNLSNTQGQSQGQQQGQGQAQGQIAIGKGGSARSSSFSGSSAGAISGSGSEASSDNSNPQSTSVEGDHYDGSLGVGYSDAPMPSSPVVDSGAVKFPQHTETYKVLGPIFGYSYTGSASCANSGAVVTALLYRDMWLQTVAHYGVTAAAPQQAQYAKTVEVAGAVCNGSSE